MSVDSTAGASTPTKKARKSLLKGGQTYWVFATVAGLVAAGGTLAILQESADKTTYYVLGQDVAARTPITPEMLVPVTTSANSEPQNALDPADLSGAEPLFAKVPLQTGDVLSASNVGALERIDAGLPAGFVATSFQVSAENAVAGKIRRGDYIDVIAVFDQDNGTGGGTSKVSKVVLHHVLVLDVAVSAQTIADAANSGTEGSDLSPGPESSAIRGGIPSMYTVGLSAEDATKLALIRDNNLMVALSANTSNGSLAASADSAAVADLSIPADDSGAGTEAAAASAQTSPGEDAATQSGQGAQATKSGN